MTTPINTDTTTAAQVATAAAEGEEEEAGSSLLTKGLLLTGGLVLGGGIAYLAMRDPAATASAARGLLDVGTAAAKTAVDTGATAVSFFRI